MGSVKKLTSLEDYVGRMQDEQPAIYYMSGGKVKEMEREASLEIFKKKGLEVLYLDEPYAELCFSKIFDFEGVKLRSVQKAGDLRVNWDKEEGERYKNLVTMYKPLTKWWEKNVAKAGVPINKVEVSRRLVDSPAVVVGTEYGQSARQERMQSVQDQDPTFFSQNQKVLEINANHPVIHDLLQKVKADPEDAAIAEIANLVAQAAVLQSNYDLEDPDILVSSVYELVSLQYGLDPNAEVEPITPEVPEKKEDVKDEDDADDEEETGPRTSSRRTSTTLCRRSDLTRSRSRFGGPGTSSSLPRRARRSKRRSGSSASSTVPASASRSACRRTARMTRPTLAGTTFPTRTRKRQCLTARRWARSASRFLRTRRSNQII